MKKVIFEITRELLESSLCFPRGIEISAIRPSDFNRDSFLIKVIGDGLPDCFEHHEGNNIPTIAPLLERNGDAVTWNWMPA